MDAIEKNLEIEEYFSGAAIQLVSDLRNGLISKTLFLMNFSDLERERYRKLNSLADELT